MIQKGSIKRATDSNQQSRKKARADLNWHAFRLRAAAEPLCHWRIVRYQICSIYGLCSIFQIKIKIPLIFIFEKVPSNPKWAASGHLSKKIWRNRNNFRWYWIVTNNNLTDKKCLVEDSTQFIPLRDWTVTAHTNWRILNSHPAKAPHMAPF